MMDRFTNIYCQNMIDELNEYPTLEPQNHDIRQCYEAIQSRNARIAELEASQRWVPVSERLPEIELSYYESDPKWCCSSDIYTIGYYDCYYKRWFCQDGEIQDVDYWMDIIPELQNTP